MGMSFLFLFHHILNRKWLKGMFRGWYTPFRTIQTMLAVLIFLCMIGSMISGLILSRYVFAFLPKYHGYEGFEKIHMLCAVCGVAAFIRRKAGIYLLLKSHFVYFDYAEPVFFFLLDYLANGAYMLKQTFCFIKKSFKSILNNHDFPNVGK